MENLELYVFFAIGVIIVLIVVWGVRAAKKRRVAFETVARQAGWQFAPGDVTPEALGAGAFPLFDVGQVKLARHVMRGSSGSAALTVFDYRYTIGIGRHSKTSNQTVVRIQSPRLALPPFVLAPENVIDKVAGILGSHDIDFEGSPEFSSQYLLRSKEEPEQVRHVFSPTIRAWFEQHEKVTVEARGDSLLFYRRATTVKPDNLRAFVEEALSIARLFER